MDEDTPTCDVCGGPATPGGDPRDPDVNTICPACEDARQARDPVGHLPPAAPKPVPPHGNTTR